MKLGIMKIDDNTLKIIDGARKNHIEPCLVYDEEGEAKRELLKREKDIPICDNENFFFGQEMDFIYISKTMNHPISLALKALSYNKNVIMEEITSFPLDKIEELKTMAIKKHCFLFENRTLLYLPYFKVLKKEIQKIGALKMIQSNQSIVSDDQIESALVDLNGDTIYMALELFGQPEETTYMPFMSNHLDRSGLLILKYPHFMISSVGVNSELGRSFVSIQGEKGYMYVPSDLSKMLSLEIHLETQNFGFASQSEQNLNVFSFRDFKAMYERNQQDECYHILERSLEVLKIIEDVCQMCAIQFPVRDM